MDRIQKLKTIGRDTAEGLGRFMNNETFYLQMINRFLETDVLSGLTKSLRENNLQEAFEQAHALKGVTGNLSLTPLYEKMCDITELLRAKEDADYDEKLASISECLETIKATVKE